MMTEEIEGWRVGLEGRTLEISGPGNLKIEIKRFKPVEVGVEGSVNLEMDPPKFFEFSFTYFEVASKCRVCLDYYFTGEPEAYLFVGCAYWVIPCKFAQQLVHVFLLGDTSRSCL